MKNNGNPIVPAADEIKWNCEEKMPIRLIVPMQAAPGKQDELIEAFRILARDVRQESGCEEFELYQSTERPDHLALLEVWADEAMLENHAELNRQRGIDFTSLRTGSMQAERYIVKP
jgi:quinol monooxygenase YgiN